MHMNGFKHDTCTHGKEAKVAFKVGGLTVIGGGADDIWSSQHKVKPDIYISVGGDMMMDRASESVLDWQGDFAKLMPKVSTYYLRPHQPKARLTIDWPDMGIPPVNGEWWDCLAADLLKVKGTVAIFCMGGHGRTGTALAILAYKMGLVPKGKDPVTWVRENYCENAVESKGQIEYINSIGVPTAAKGGKDYSGAYSMMGRKDNDNTPGQFYYDGKWHDIDGKVGEGPANAPKVGEVGKCNWGKCTDDGVWDSVDMMFLCDDHWKSSVEIHRKGFSSDEEAFKEWQYGMGA